MLASTPRHRRVARPRAPSTASTAGANALAGLGLAAALLVACSSSDDAVGGRGDGGDGAPDARITAGGATTGSGGSSAASGGASSGFGGTPASGGAAASGGASPSGGASARGGSPATGGAAAGDAGPVATSCDPRRIMCRRAPPVCVEGEVPSVVGTCYGDCVPIDACICSEPEACPDSNQHTCHNFRQRCGPYVR